MLRFYRKSKYIKMFNPYMKNINKLWILVCLNVCFGFYLPGLAPVNYCRDSESSPQCKVSSLVVYIKLYT